MMAVLSGKQKLIIATNNSDKLAEIKNILRNTNLEILSAGDFDDFPKIRETAGTLLENALLKARGVWEKYHLPCLADDTGLEVDCLGGRPGVYSSRYAGDDATYNDNCDKLLRELADKPSADRAARFRCVMVFIDRDGIEHTAEGLIEGTITESRRGLSGFGYDPLFLLPSEGKTLAELGPDEKNKISHRHNALVKITPIIKEKLLFRP